MKESKLIPFLQNMLKSQECGLRYINEEEGIFAIPWPHSCNKALTKEIQVCKAICERWMKVGSLRKSNKLNHSSSKSRFRSALNYHANAGKSLIRLTSSTGSGQNLRIYQFAKNIHDDSRKLLINYNLLKWLHFCD